MKILIMLVGDINVDPRPNRLLEILNTKKIAIDILSNNTKIESNPKIRKNYKFKNNAFINSSFILKVIFTFYYAFKCNLIKNPSKSPKYYEIFYSLSEKLRKELISNRYDFIIVEDIVLLSQAFKLSEFSKIIFDAREFYEEQNSESLKFNLLLKPIRKSILSYSLKRCHYIYTVSETIANAYQSKYKVKVGLLRSVPFNTSNKIKIIDKNNIKLVHHGIGYKSRGIKDMIDIVKSLDKRFSLDLYLVAEPNYLLEIKKYIGDIKRIKLKKPVKYNKIIPMLTNYDIGLFFVQPATFNLLNCLPNKLFEFIQARLAIAVSPSYEMKKIVNTYNCGFVSETFNKESMITLLNNLNLEDLKLAKKNSNIASRELCFEKESIYLLKNILKKYK